MLIGSCASPTPALQLSGPEFVNLAPVFLPFQFMTPLAGLCIGFAFARARLASLGYQSYVLNNLFAATLFSARIPDALHLLPLCSPPTALSHGLSLIPLAAPGCCWLLLAAPGCSWLLLPAPGCFCLLLAAPARFSLLLAAPGCFWLLLAVSGCYIPSLVLNLFDAAVWQTISIKTLHTPIILTSMSVGGAPAPPPPFYAKLTVWRH